MNAASHAVRSGVARPLVFALVVFALLALATLRLSKGERMAPPPEWIEVRPVSR
jgi:hypothetical protein